MWQSGRVKQMGSKQRREPVLSDGWGRLPGRGGGALLTCARVGALVASFGIHSNCPERYDLFLVGGGNAVCPTCLTKQDHPKGYSLCAAENLKLSAAQCLSITAVLKEGSIGARLAALCPVCMLTLWD